MRTLLITDDHASVRTTLEYVLGFHYRVLLASSGFEAQQIIKTETIDAALVDLHMPGMDGFQTCEALLTYTREQGKILPVWLMTAAFSAVAQKRALEIGAVALLSKPFDCEALVAALEKSFADQPRLAKIQRFEPENKALAVPATPHAPEAVDDSQRDMRERRGNPAA